MDAYNPGVLLTGFVTETVAEGDYKVFIPPASNPLNGNIYHVPARPTFHAAIALVSAGDNF
ncbi:MAG TPA: hypothetical protein VK957_11420 [Lunatimonas sp.]|nr:hypothetical protein [Lunatimonas sp.]